MRYRKDVLIARVVFVLLIALVIGIIASVATRISANKKNQQVAEVVEEAEQTEQVEVDDTEFAEIVVETNDVEEDEVFVKTTAVVNFRKDPTTDGAFISTIPKDTELVLEGEDGGWSKVTYNGQTGYVNSNYVTKVTVGTVDSDITPMITTTGVRMRSGPGSDYSLICDISANTELSVFSIENGWAKIYYKEKTGYCSAQYLREKE